MTTQRSTNSMDTQKHAVFTQHGWNLNWEKPYEITLSSGKKRMVQNYSFKNNERLYYFCKVNIEKLKLMSYTFGDPTNPRHLGFYRIAYYYPADTKVETKQELLKIQQELLKIQHDLFGTTQRLSNVINKT